MGESADRGPGYPRYTVSCSYPQGKFRENPKHPLRGQSGKGVSCFFTRRWVPPRSVFPSLSFFVTFLMQRLYHASGELKLRAPSSKKSPPPPRSGKKECGGGSIFSSLVPFLKKSPCPAAKKRRCGGLVFFQKNLFPA